MAESLNLRAVLHNWFLVYDGFFFISISQSSQFLVLPDSYAGEVLLKL